MAILYYNLRTVYAGPAEPLSATGAPRSVPRTGWGPRGDSGPERDRVRATQPANSPFSGCLRQPALPPENERRKSQAF